MATRPLPAGPLVPAGDAQLQRPVVRRYAVAVGDDVDPFALADEVLVPLRVGGTRRRGPRAERVRHHRDRAGRPAGVGLGPRRLGRRGVLGRARGRRPRRAGVQPHRRRDHGAPPGSPAAGWSTCAAARSNRSRGGSRCGPAASPRSRSPPGRAPDRAARETRRQGTVASQSSRVTGESTSRSRPTADPRLRGDVSLHDRTRAARAVSTRRPRVAAAPPPSRPVRWARRRALTLLAGAGASAVVLAACGGSGRRRRRAATTTTTERPPARAAALPPAGAAAPGTRRARRAAAIPTPSPRRRRGPTRATARTDPTS